MLSPCLGGAAVPVFAATASTFCFAALAIAPSVTGSATGSSTAGATFFALPFGAAFFFAGGGAAGGAGLLRSSTILSRYLSDQRIQIVLRLINGKQRHWRNMQEQSGEYQASQPLQQTYSSQSGPLSLLLLRRTSERVVTMRPAGCHGGNRGNLLRRDTATSTRAVPRDGGLYGVSRKYRATERPYIAIAFAIGILRIQTTTMIASGTTTQ